MAASPGSGAQNKEVVFDLDAVAFSSDHFRMHEFKVKRCPRARPHDWTQCPFAHPGEKARRRDPRRYRYSGTACPEFRKSGCCRRGDACPFAHGVFECWLHPSRYRTQLCTDGAGCKRRVCFFAHSEAEIRRPEDDPVVAQCQVEAELAAEVQTLQQQHLTQALTALLDTKGQTAQGGPAGLAGQLNLLTLELLKQATPSNQVLPSSGEPATGNQSLQMALIQQLALVEQVQKQQQQQHEQAQQLLNTVSSHSGAAGGTDPKTLQALLAVMSQTNQQETVKNQLVEQLKTNNPVLEALNLLATGGSAVGGAGSVQSENNRNGQLQVSAPLGTMNGTVGSLGVQGVQAQDAAAVSAALAMNGAVGPYEVAGRVGGVDPTPPLSMSGQVPLLHTNGFLDGLAPGQLVALRDHAAATGGRRSIDNGVLARSVSDLMDALDTNSLGTQSSQMATLGGDGAAGQVLPAGFSVPLSMAQPVQSLDGNGAASGWINEEALKQAKSLLENLSFLQGGKNGTTGAVLPHAINMESLLTANRMSAMSRILEELPQSMSEVGVQEGAQLYHHAANVAGGDAL